jgi:hypothetical protein
MYFFVRQFPCAPQPKPPKERKEKERKTKIQSISLNCAWQQFIQPFHTYINVMENPGSTVCHTDQS